MPPRVVPPELPAETPSAILVPALGRGALLGLATWVAIGPLPALMAAPGVALAGGLERWGARGSWRRPLATFLTVPLVVGLSCAAAFQGLWARASLELGPARAGKLVSEALSALPADPEATSHPLVREWLAGLPWWRAGDDATSCLMATATLLGLILGLVVAGRLLLVSPNPEMQSRLPGLATLGSAVGACVLGLVWSAWLLPAAPPGDPGLQGLTLWGFAVLLGMATPLAYGATDALEPLLARRP